MKKINTFSSNWKRLVAFIMVIAIMICSITFIANIFTDPQTYSETIESIDEKKVTVLGVSAAIAGSSTLLAAIPDDATTPLADKMMDLCSYLVVVICVLVLEKSLLTVFGAVACYALFPLACVFALVYIINNKKTFLEWAIKFAILSLAVLIIVPSAMRLSDYIFEINQVSFEQEVETIVQSDENEEKEDIPWYQKLKDSLTKTVKKTVDSALESGKNALNKFVDAVSVFVIAYCAIPIFVVFLLLWLLKILFRVDINIDALHPKRLIDKRKEKTDS